MLADPKLCCHRTGFAKKCRSLVAEGKCNRWIMIEGNDPVTNQPLQRWDCVDNWHIALLLDVSKRIANGSRDVERSVLSFRDEMVSAQQPHAALHLLSQLKLPPV